MSVFDRRAIARFSQRSARPGGWVRVVAILFFCCLQTTPVLAAVVQETVTSTDDRGTIPSTDVIETEQRVKLIGAMGATVVSLLFVALGYLRLNHATQGFYSRRLLIFALLLSLLIFLACVIYLVPLFG